MMMMERDLQIETEKEKDDERSVYSKVKKPYRAFLHGEWDAMQRFYEKNPQLIFERLTIEEDTAFHIAAYSGRTELLRCFLGLVPNSRQSEVAMLKNCHGNTTLHEVASTDNIEAAELLISKLQMADDRASTVKELLEDRNQLGETPLYRSAALGKFKMLKFFAKRVGNIKDHFQRNDSFSILHITVFGQHFEIAVWLLEKHKELGKRKTDSGMTCLHVLAKMSSAFQSSTQDNIIKTLLYRCLPDHLYDHDNEDEDDKDHDGSSDHGHEASVRDLESEISSKSPRMPKAHSSAISRMYNAMWRTAAKEWPSIEKVWKRRRTNKSAVKLTKLLVQMDTTWEKSFIVEDNTVFLGSVDSLDDVFIDVEGKGGQSSTKSTTATVNKGGTKSSGSRLSDQEPYTPLLIAATEGVLEIVDEILQQHPQAIEHVSKDEENILHVAISHRQLEVFRYLKEMDVILSCRLVSRLNVRGYTILHQVADMKNSREGNEAAGGPAFELKNELKWLQRVQKIMPPHYRLHRDNDGRTANELFREQHAPLLKEAKKWLKDTSGSCSTVAVLVAGVVFAAAYSIPGGTNEDGVPRFLHSPIFMVFTITDIIALASSLTSVVMFLMITSSPLEQDYFYQSIPRKLMIGFSFLFLSMILSMISFSASLLLILRFDQKRSWTPLVYAVALLPVCMFGIVQFPLYASLTSTLHYLHKTITKRVLPQAFLHRNFLKKGKSINNKY